MQTVLAATPTGRALVFVLSTGHVLWASPDGTLVDVGFGRPPRPIAQPRAAAGGGGVSVVLGTFAGWLGGLAIVAAGSAIARRLTRRENRPC